MTLLQPYSRIAFFNSCDSTQNVFREFPDENYDLVYTFNQTQGKGQYGNKWQCEGGKSLALSICINENLVLWNAILFNYLIAIIIRDFIQCYVEDRVCIKFPNDIYCRNKKLCGILIEKHHQKYIIGIGINVLPQDFSNLPKAGSISEYSKKCIDINEFSLEFIRYLYQDFLFTDDEIVDKTNKYLYRKNQVSVIEYNQKIINTKVLKIDSEGNIFFEFDDDKIIKLKHKEFCFLS